MVVLPSRRDNASGRTPFIVSEPASTIYQDGRYLEQNPSWHMEESPFKVGQIRRMLDRRGLAPKTVCDVGCGAGLVLAELQNYLPQDCMCWGYDISADAVAQCQPRGNERLKFVVRDIRRDPAMHFSICYSC